MTVIAIPRILRERLTDEGAEALVEIFDKIEEQAEDKTIKIVEEKFERRLIEETSKLRNELIKWMFIFWIGQFASIVGVLTAILFAFFRK